MHFVNLFLNSSCPYILAQGGVTVSVFGTTVFVMYMTSPPPHYFLYALRFVSVCPDRHCSEKQSMTAFSFEKSKKC